MACCIVDFEVEAILEWFHMKLIGVHCDDLLTSVLYSKDVLLIDLYAKYTSRSDVYLLSESCKNMPSLNAFISVSNYYPNYNKLRTIWKQV